MLLQKWSYKYLFNALLSILLGIYPEMELLEDREILCLFFVGPAILLSTGAAPFYISISNTQESQFLHTLINTCYFLFFFKM